MHGVQLRSKLRHRIQCLVHVFNPRIALVPPDLKRHVPLPHPWMPTLLAVCLPPTRALN